MLACHKSRSKISMYNQYNFEHTFYLNMKKVMLLKNNETLTHYPKTKYIC